MEEISVENDKILERLAERAEAGEDIVLTRGGKPVARIVPNAIDRSDAVAAMQRILEIGDDVSLGTLRFRDLIVEGRKY